MKPGEFVLTAVSLLAATNSNGQNVGIGTNAPTRARFEVNGAVDATSAIFGGESSGVSLQRNWPGIGLNTYYNAGNKNITSGFSSKLYMDPSNGYLYLDMQGYAAANAIPATASRSLTISPLGNIGLAGAAPNAELQLPNTIVNRKIVLWETANNNNQYYGFGLESGVLRYSVGDVSNVHRFYAGNGANASNLLMSIWGTKIVVIADDNGGGKLGINLSNPGYTLSIKQAANTGIYLQEAGSGTNWELRAYYYAPTDARDLILRHDGADVGFFRSTGEYVGYSDRRLKTNIVAMPPTLSKLLQLKPSVYEMKANNSRHEKSIGFVAQEVQQLFPDLVSTLPGRNENGLGDLMGISYSGFGVIAIKAIQEQQEEINELKEEVEMLLAQNKILENALGKK